MRIALLGTGILGHSIAERLLHTYDSLYVYNRSRSKAEDLLSLGATLCNTPAEAIAAADALFLVLTDAKTTKTVLASAEEKTLFEKKTFFQLGTISPMEAEELNAYITQKGGVFIELPVLGSKNEAKNGSLLLMFGANEEQYHKWHDFLSSLGKVFFVAEPKKAAVLKLALNQLIISSMVGFSLSFAMVIKENIDPKLFMNILRASALYCSTYDKKLPRLVKKDYELANFTLDLLLKDLKLCLEETERLSIESAPLEISRTIIEQALKRGYGQKDYSALFEAIFSPKP
ncbi:cupin [Methylacidiphilum caldifontis]|uniref:Cupin n=1 Tax=Methylacidiphilum caldifontis TaxID=2795386 RepID=A0A4Y8PC17_9BACT|nr:cupin [Methylacidiphilum caldifontis]